MILLDIPLTRTADFANHHYLNQLEEAWHDEPFAMGVDAPAAMASCEVATTCVREDSGRRAAVESEARRPDGLALPLSTDVAVAA